VLLSQFVIGLISTNQHWFACAPLSEAELERFSLNASDLEPVAASFGSTEEVVI
jgi:hypothetical protein